MLAHSPQSATDTPLTLRSARIPRFPSAHKREDGYSCYLAGGIGGLHCGSGGRHNGAGPPSEKLATVWVAGFGLTTAARVPNSIRPATTPVIIDFMTSLL